jgi:hypothetical protein
MPNPENIVKHKWKKGQTGNPNGRPKLIPDLKEVIAEVFSQTNERGITLLEGIVTRQAKIAANGKDNDSTRAFDVLMKYVYSPKTEAKQEVKQVIIWGDANGNDGSEHSDKTPSKTDGNFEAAESL